MLQEIEGLEKQNRIGHANYVACSKGLELRHQPLSNLIRFN